MSQTALSVHIPASKNVLLLVEIFLNPRHAGGGGSIPSVRHCTHAEGFDASGFGRVAA